MNLTAEKNIYLYKTNLIQTLASQVRHSQTGATYSFSSNIRRVLNSLLQFQSQVVNHWKNIVPDVNATANSKEILFILSLSYQQQYLNSLTPEKYTCFALWLDFFKQPF